MFFIWNAMVIRGGGGGKLMVDNNAFVATVYNLDTLCSAAVASTTTLQYILIFIFWIFKKKKNIFIFLAIIIIITPAIHICTYHAHFYSDIGVLTPSRKRKLMKCALWAFFITTDQGLPDNNMYIVYIWAELYKEFYNIIIEDIFF